MMKMTTTGTMTTTPTAATTEQLEPSTEGSRLKLPAWTRSARTRIAIGVLTLLAVSSLASVLALRQILVSRAGDRVDRALDQEVLEFRRLAEIGRDPRSGQPFGNDIKAVFEVFLARNVPLRGEAFYTFVDGVPFRSSADAAPADPLLAEIAALGAVAAPTRGELEGPDGELRYLAVPIDTEGPRGAFAVTISLDQELEEINEAVRIAAGVSIVVFLLASVAVFAAVGRFLAPVRVLTDTARSISESDLTRRIEVAGNDELAELARTFNAMLERLEEAFAGQRRFLGDAGHELRTPITIVRGHLEVMGDDPEERRETIALVTDELDRMGRLVDELLLLERTQRPDFLRRDTVHLADLLDETVAKAQAIADRDWVQSGERRGTIAVDRQRLQQALLNLAENSAKHTAPGDRIQIGAELRGGMARLWVRDSGPGIDPGEQGRVFERFQRAGDNEGTGLGLAVVKAIAEAHGGRVELESSLGAGATFTLVVPADGRPKP
jgi:signal transduction histidine kinase